MTKRGHSADGKTGLGSYEVRVCFAKCLTRDRRRANWINAVAASG